MYFSFHFFIFQADEAFVESIHRVEYEEMNTNEYILFLIYAIICIVSYNLSKNKRKQIIKW